MAGIFRDGFDVYSGVAAPAGLSAKWTVIGAPTLVAGRFGGQAVRCTNGVGLRGVMDTATANLSVNCGVNVTTMVTNTPKPWIMFYSATGVYTLGVQFATGGFVIVYRMTSATAGTEIGRSAALAVNEGQFYTFEMEAVISDAAGRVSIWLDGNLVVNLTAVDTNNAAGTVARIEIGQAMGAAGVVVLDDLYVTDSATKPLKATRIVTLPVNSDGGTLNLVPSTGSSHFAVVDELPVSATDYLSGTVVGDRDILGVADLSATPTGIEEVNVVMFAQATDAAVRSINLGLISGATTDDGAAQTLSATGNRHDRPLAVDPNTSGAWTAAGVNGINLQPKVAA